jgi:hypothetical protein
MKISLKVILGLWIGLFLIIGGLLFNAYSRLKPETFIALLTEQVQKNYPGSKLDVGKVSYGFSLDFNLNLKEIHLRRGGKLLGSVAEVELKVPWWLLILNKGNAQINLKQLDIYIDHAESVIVKEKLSRPSNNIIKVTLPNYLAEARFTVRAKEVSVRDIHNSRRYFMISKLLVREFQYGKNSAFELNIPISIKHRETQYSSDLWLFGDITPDPSEWRLNYRGEFRTKENNDKFQIEDLVINGFATFLPSTLSITSDLNLLVEKELIGKGRLVAGQENLNVVMQFSKLPLNYFSLVYEDIKNPFLKKLDGNASGSLKFEKDFNSSLASVNGKITFSGDFSISDTFIFPGKWQIGFQDARWEISFISPKGEASFFRRSYMDMSRNLVTQFVQEIGFTGLEMSQVMPAVPALDQFIKETPSSYFTSSISFNKCLQGDKIIDGNFKHGFTPDQRFYHGELKHIDSSMLINYADKSAQKSVDINFVKFRMLPHYQFLAPYFTVADSILNGKVEGRWSTTWSEGLWLMQVSAENLTAARGKIPDLISKTGSFFELETTTSPKMNLNLSVKNNTLLLNSLMLEVPESTKITGTLNAKQKSYLMMSNLKNKKLKPVKKEILEPYWVQKEEI